MVVGFPGFMDKGGRVEANFNYITTLMNLGEPDTLILLQLTALRNFCSIDPVFLFLYVHDTDLSEHIVNGMRLKNKRTNLKFTFYVFSFKMTV